MHFIELNLWRSLEILFIRCDTQIVSDISTEQYSHIGNEIFSREFSQLLKTNRLRYHFMKRNIFRLASYLICNAFIIIRFYYQLSTIYKSLVGGFVCFFDDQVGNFGNRMLFCELLYLNMNKCTNN